MFPACWMMLCQYWKSWNNRITVWEVIFCVQKGQVQAAKSCELVSAWVKCACRCPWGWMSWAHPQGAAGLEEPQLSLKSLSPQFQLTQPSTAGTAASFTFPCLKWDLLVSPGLVWHLCGSNRCLRLCYRLLGWLLAQRVGDRQDYEWEARQESQATLRLLLAWINLGCIQAASKQGADARRGFLVGSVIFFQVLLASSMPVASSLLSSYFRISQGSSSSLFSENKTNKCCAVWTSFSSSLF